MGRTGRWNAANNPTRKRLGRDQKRPKERPNKALVCGDLPHENEAVMNQTTDMYFLKLIHNGFNAVKRESGGWGMRSGLVINELNVFHDPEDHHAWHGLMFYDYIHLLYLWIHFRYGIGCWSLAWCMQSLHMWVMHHIFKCSLFHLGICYLPSYIIYIL